MFQPEAIAVNLDDHVGKQVTVEGILNLDETRDGLSYLTSRRTTNPIFPDAVFIDFTTTQHSKFFSMVRYETEPITTPTIHYPANITGIVARANKPPFRASLSEISEIVLYFNNRIIFLRSTVWNLADFTFADPRNFFDWEWWLEGQSIETLPLITVAEALRQGKSLINKPLRLSGHLIGPIWGNRDDDVAHTVFGMWIPKASPYSQLSLPIIGEDRNAVFKRLDEERQPNAANCICIDFPRMNAQIGGMHYWGRIGGPFCIMEDALIIGSMGFSHLNSFRYEIFPMALAIAKEQALHLWLADPSAQP